MKSDRLLDDIKARIDIVELVSDYVELKKAGQNYKANCPFHSEKTPSFMVSPSKQIFHCFGCGAGGDIFGFIMKYESINFQEAIKLLAKKAGIKLSSYRFESDLTEKKEKLYAVQKEALRVFTENLRKSKTALSYLAKRGLVDDTIHAFSLGYAIREWRALYEHLKAKGFEDSIIVQSGLVFSGEKGLHDIFRNRIIFPIFNIHGDAVAFGGRAIDNAMPKYLNSPETLLFKKGETLYALNLARDEIRKKDYVMVVEGYLDVIMCHQYGYRNVVAPLGTALTIEHLQKLGRFSKKVVLIFDSDAAGIAAAKRSIALLHEHGFRSKVLLLPEGEDPDSFLRKNSAQAFQTRLAGAKSAVDFILGLRGEKADNIRTAIEIIKNTKDLILREELFRELSEKSGIREAVIREEAGKYGQRHTGNTTVTAPKEKVFLHNEDTLLLSAIVTFPEKARHIFELLDIDAMHTPVVKEIFKKIKPLAYNNNLNINTMLNALSEEEKTIVTRLSLNPGFDTEHVDKNIRDCIRKIAHHRIEEKIKEARDIGDIQLLNSLLMERQKLLKSA